MTWYVIEVEDDATKAGVLKGKQYRFLVNQQYTVKPEQRDTPSIVDAALTKYPKAKSRYTSRFFDQALKPALLTTLEQAVANYLKLKDARGLSVDVVAVIQI